MKKLFAIALLASFTTLAAPLQWTCDWPEAKSQTFSLYQGETATFEPTFRVNGRTVTNATIEAVWYQTNGMGNAWWKLSGNTFAPSNDVGAAAYRFFVEAKTSDDILYRANGALRMLPSPGFTPNTIELPVARLDFAAVEVLNPPWTDPDYSTNNTELVETIHQTEVDPTVPAWAKKTVGGFYSDNLYSLVNRDFYAKDSSIKSQHSIWLKGDLNTTVTVGRDNLSDNTFPYARQTVLGFSAYEGFDYYAHYRPRGIYIWPWWNEDAEDDIAYLFPTNGNGGTFALTSDIAAAISPTSPAFSNAVLSVGLGIDTNTVAVINELVDSSQGLPVSGMTSVGALLLALAAAIAALKRGKADKPSSFTAGNLASLDASGNPTDSKIPKSDIESLLFAQYYPDGSVKSAAELTSGIKYDFNDTDRTASALPFCNTGTREDNHTLTGRVVMPAFVDRQGEPYLFDDGTKYKVVEVMDDTMDGFGNSGLTDIIAPTTVTRVGVNSFCGCGDLVSASFPGVTTVDIWAFYGCEGLESIALPLAATIGDESFVGCSSLASATLPAVTSIGERSFANCSALAYVLVPSVRTIGRNAFARCSSLASVEIPSATTVDYAAFTGCSSITAVSAPMATSVGEQAFKDCSALASIELPSATGIGANAFWACSSLKSAALPSATTIGIAAFANCSSLASVEIPSATAIGDSAFYHCIALDVLDFGSVQSVPTLGIGAFQDVPATCKIVVPDAQYSVWVAASGWSDLVTAGYKFLRHSEWEHARKYDLRYDLGTPIVINTASSEVVEGETVYYGAATLANRTANIVQVTATLDELRITFPAATSGKVRDFGLRVEIGTGSAALTAPALVPIAPTGETIKIENSDAEIPALADGTATAKGVTLLYFSQNAPGIFVVKGEQVEEVA